MKFDSDPSSFMSEDRIQFLQELVREDPITILDLGARRTQEPPSYQKLTPLSPRVIGIDVEGSAETGFKAQFSPDVATEFMTAFLGAGEVRDFYECEQPSVSSVYEPNGLVCDTFDGLAEASTIRRSRRIKTRLLEDVVGCRDVDLLKSDLQGADLHVLQHAPKILARSMLVIVEVEFIPQFKGAPLCWTVAESFQKWDFVFHSFLDFGTRPLAGFNQLWSQKRRGYRQWLWGNAVFIPSFHRLRNAENRKILKLAVIMDLVMTCYDYTWKLLHMHDERVGTSFSDRYKELLSKSN
jgi:hypothetical protein